MTQRYYCPHLTTATEAVLAGAEAHHLIHVMRLRAGSRVVLFDGSGAEFPAEVCAVKRERVLLKVLARHQVDRELPVSVVLGVAMPKGERQRWLVEKAVELGVARLAPLQCARGVAQATTGALRRWRRAVVEACKQCGRNRLMELSEPLAWPQFVEEAHGAAWRLLAHPRAAADSPGPTGATLDSSAEQPAVSFARGARPEAAADPLERLLDQLRQHDLQQQAGPWVATSAPACSAAPEAAPAPAPAPRIVLAVGPEGGFTEQELQLARAGSFELVDLGPRTLRVETAAVALAAAIALACRPAPHTSHAPRGESP